MRKLQKLLVSMIMGYVRDLGRDEHSSSSVELPEHMRYNRKMNDIISDEEPHTRK